MDHTHYGYPTGQNPSPEGGQPSYGASGSQGPSMPAGGCEGGSGAPGSPGPTPFPPSPMMPGPSMQSGGCEGGSGQPGSCGGSGGAAGQSTGPEHAGTGGCTGHSSPGMSPGGGYANHPPLHEAYHYGYYPPGSYPAGSYPAVDDQGYSILGLNLSDGNFWKGALIGAGIALLITNDTVQKTVMKGVASAYSAAQGAVGEMKEKFEDAQAEVKGPKK